jgi:beta-lactamase class D
MNSIRMLRSSLYVLWLIPIATPSYALTQRYFKKEFKNSDGCFLLSDLRTGKMIEEFNPKRCRERLSPCSSFKIAAALMAYEKGVLKSEDDVIKWDGVQRERPELNQDQTPASWMRNSAKWVTEWIMPQIGLEQIQKFLDSFSYGNKDFSGGLKDAWQTTSLKISAYEQLAFISKLWKNKLPLSKHTFDMTKKAIFIKRLGKESDLYGKTGTGCLQGHSCMEHPDKMLGWFVGILHNGQKEYAIVGNASDLTAQGPPAGPRMRATVIRMLEHVGVIK